MQDRAAGMVSLRRQEQERVREARPDNGAQGETRTRTS